MNEVTILLDISCTEFNLSGMKLKPSAKKLEPLAVFFQHRAMENGFYPWWNATVTISNSLHTSPEIQPNAYGQDTCS